MLTLHMLNKKVLESAGKEIYILVDFARAFCCTWQKPLGAALGGVSENNIRKMLHLHGLVVVLVLMGVQTG